MSAYGHTYIHTQELCMDCRTGFGALMVIYTYIYMHIHIYVGVLQGLQEKFRGGGDKEKKTGADVASLGQTETLCFSHEVFGM